MFARKIDPDLRAERRAYDDGVVDPLSRNSALIAKVMFAIEGTSTYPDATFTLRFSFGTVKGYRENGRDIAPFTTIGGAFARATGNTPFKLPDSWIAARAHTLSGPAVRFRHQQRHHRRQFLVYPSSTRRARWSASSSTATTPHENACRPVCARPRISAWTSCVPS